MKRSLKEQSDKDFHLTARIGILFFGLILILSSCSNNEPELIVEKPTNLIPKEEFIQVMSDVVMLESHIQKTIPRPEMYSIPMNRSVDSLLNSKNISMNAYKSSFDYYGVQQEEMKEILQAVLDTLSIRKNTLINQSGVSGRDD